MSQKKLTLIYPPPQDNYQDVVFSVKEAPSLPQTALAELGAYVQKYSTNPIEVVGINSQKRDQGNIRCYTPEEIIQLSADSDIIGLTCLYHNQERALEIASSIKKQDSSKTIILGGQNVSNPFMARLILNQFPTIDYIVLGAGEDALLSLVENHFPEKIPNLAYRKKGNINFTERKAVDINRIPLWNYENILGAKSILEAHDSRTELYQELVRRYQGRTVGELGVFSQRGCPKASGKIGKYPGACQFCTSVEKPHSEMEPINFWRQLELLNQKYGLQDFFIADNVFGTSLTQLRRFKEAREQFDIPNTVQFRAYTYPGIINGPEGKEIAQQLRELGIINLFLGLETFNAEISRLANKDPVTYQQLDQAITRLSETGIDTFISFMPGLRGESKASLQQNLDYLEKILSRHSSREYGNGKLVRVDISPAMPLIGSTWHQILRQNPSCVQDYFTETEKDLTTDITPDFEVLRNLSLKYYSTNITGREIKEFEIQAKQLCLKYLKPEMIGGFDLRKNDAS